MSTGNEQSVLMIAHITAQVDACLHANDERLLAVRQGGWDSQAILEYANALKGMGKQCDAMEFADTHFGKDLVGYASANYPGKSAAESVRKLADGMANLEFRSLPVFAEKSLQAMDFSTKTVTRGGRCAIEASGKGNAKLLMLIEDGGAGRGIGVKTDWANLADRSCLTLQNDFERKMSALGVELTGCDASEGLHMDPRGGQLIKEAGRMHAEDLATGILLHEENREQFCQTLYDKPDGNCPARKERV